MHVHNVCLVTVEYHGTTHLLIFICHFNYGAFDKSDLIYKLIHWMVTGPVSGPFIFSTHKPNQHLLYNVLQLLAFSLIVLAKNSQTVMVQSMTN